MTISYFTETHYEELTQWWNKHQHQIIPMSSLPIGVVVSDNNTNLVMSFLYTMDGVDVAQLSWTTSNPENKLKKNFEAVNLAVDALLLTAEKLGKKRIIALSSSRGLSKILNKKNITEGVKHSYHRGVL